MKPLRDRGRRADHTAFDHCACFNLRKATRAVTQMYDDVLRPTGLRATQFSLLEVLRQAGPINMTALAEAAVADRTTLTRNLAVLAEQGLIEVREGDDARVREVSLTAPGRNRLAAAQPYWEAAQQRMTAALGGARLERLLDDLSAATAAGQGR